MKLYKLIFPVAYFLLAGNISNATNHALGKPDGNRRVFTCLQ